MARKDSEDDPLYYFDKRIVELGRLKEQTVSQTLKDLFDQAIIKSTILLPKLVLLQKTTIEYLKEERMKSDERTTKYQEAINQLNEGRKQVEYGNIQSEEKQSALEYIDKWREIGGKKVQIESDLRKLQHTVFPSVARQFGEVLLDMIFKPNHQSFKYETVVDTLKIIGGLFIPAFDILLTASDNPLSVAMRQKNYINKGDKIFVYIEKYLDVLKKWETLADEYLKILQE